MVFSATMRRTVMAAAAFGLLSIAPAAAQEVSESHLAAARAAVDAIDSTNQFDNILPNAATQIKSELIDRNPNLQSEISEMVDENALALAPRRADLENEVARIYSKLFTEQELRQIADFYNSEAGKKLISQGAGATREMLAAADIWSNGIIRDLRAKAQTDMTALVSRSLATPVGDATASDQTAPAGTANQ